jgi:hypothetical protein
VKAVAVQAPVTVLPSGCPFVLNAAPKPLVDIPPFLRLDPEVWMKNAKANKALTWKLSYDVRQLYPKLTGTQVEALSAKIRAAIPPGVSDVSDRALAAINAAPQSIGPDLLALGINADPKLIARFVIARHYIFAGYSKISEAWFTRVKQGVGFKPFYIDPHGDGQYPTLKSFAKTYKGLNAGGDSFLFKAVIDGQVPMWTVDAPFDDGGRKWGVYIEFVEAHVFRITLTRMPTSWVDDVKNFLKAIVEWACGLVTHEKLQEVRNYSAAVPEPHVQAAAATWQALAAACNFAFPKNATPIIDPCALPPPPPPPPPPPQSWAEQHRTQLLVAAGAVAIVGTAVVVARRR